MVTALTDDMRQTLAERVRRRVAGRGVPRHVIHAAIERVADALQHASPVPVASPPEAPSGADTILVAFSSAAHPDLTSRVRAVLAREQIAVLEAGSAAAGRYTVTTLRLPASAEARAEALAAALGARCVVLRAGGDAGFALT